MEMVRGRKTGLLRIWLIAALLVNSAGQGYALRPMAAANSGASKEAETIRSIKSSSAGQQKIEVIEKVNPPKNKPVLVLCDVHGTLLMPTWEKECREVFKILMGDYPPQEWMEKYIFGRTDDEILQALSTESKRPIIEAADILEQVRNQIREKETTQEIPGAVDFLWTLRRVGIPSAIISGTKRELLISQLKRAGLYYATSQYQPEKHIYARSTEDRTSYNRAEVIEKIWEDFGRPTIIYFDDWIEGMEKIRQLGGICVGLPQGEGEVFKVNREKLIEAGTHYILSGGYDYKKIVDEILSPVFVNVLDIGSGDGEGTWTHPTLASLMAGDSISPGSFDGIVLGVRKWMAKKGIGNILVQVTGLDKDEKMVKEARMHHYNVYPIHLVKEKKMYTGFPPNSFDLITIFAPPDVDEWFVRDMMPEVKRLLRTENSGGEIWIQPYISGTAEGYSAKEDRGFPEFKSTLEGNGFIVEVRRNNAGEFIVGRLPSADSTISGNSRSSSAGNGIPANREIYLDIGAGIGGLAVRLAQNNPQGLVYAVDSKYKKRKAEGREYITKHAPEVILIPKRFKRWDAEDLAGRVDHIYWFFPDKVLPSEAVKIAGLLKPGGAFTMVLDDAKVKWLDKFKERLCREGLQVEYTPGIAFKELYRHERLISASTMYQNSYFLADKLYPEDKSAVLRATKLPVSHERGEFPDSKSSSAGSRGRNRAATTRSQQASTDPLKALSYKKAQGLAGVLREIIDDVEFDKLNKRLHTALYGIEALPLDSGFISWIKEQLRYGDELTDIDIRRREAFLFFMFGEALSRKKIERIFGEDKEEYIDDFIRLGIFIPAKNGKIRMNSLSLASKRLNNGECVYVFADTPERFGTSLYPRKVYIGPDSYTLLSRIEQFTDLSGVAVDMGTGSGIQLIALLKLFSGISKGIGMEINERAINVCRFNAYLNGVGDRLKVVKDKRAFRKELAGERIGFVTMNPPFIPIPEMVCISPEEKDLLGGVLPVIETEDLSYLNLKEIYPTSSWGGTDGIAVTRQFMDMVLPLLEDGAQILIYSCFAGDKDGPTKIGEYLRSQDGLSFNFEPESVPSIEALDWAVDIMYRICSVNPVLQQERFKRFRQALVDKINESFAQSGITHIHDGYITARFKNPPTTEPKASSAGGANISRRNFIKGAAAFTATALGADEIIRAFGQLGEAGSEQGGQPIRSNADIEQYMQSVDYSISSFFYMNSKTIVRDGIPLTLPRSYYMDDADVPWIFQEIRASYPNPGDEWAEWRVLRTGGSFYGGSCYSIHNAHFGTIKEMCSDLPAIISNGYWGDSPSDNNNMELWSVNVDYFPLAGEIALPFRITDVDGNFNYNDPHPQVDHVSQWPDWLPSSGESSWDILSAAHAHNRKYPGEYSNSVELIVAEEIAGNLIKMQAENGGIRRGLPSRANRNAVIDYTSWDGISTENNISAYAAFRALYEITGKEEYKAVMDGIERYFLSVATYRTDPKTGAKECYFALGARVGINGEAVVDDSLFATDCQAWAILCLGIDKVNEIFYNKYGESVGRFEASYLMWDTTKRRTGQIPNRRTNILTGFSFYDKAANVKQKAVMVEQTAGGILAALTLADYYKGGDRGRALLYDAFTMRQHIETMRVDIVKDEMIAYPYASKRVYNNFNWWIPPPQVLNAASTAWVGFVNRGFNPFYLEAPEIPAALEISFLAIESENQKRAELATVNRSSSAGAAKKAAPVSLPNRRVSLSIKSSA